MAYLNLELEYLNNPKTTRLISRLGRGSEVLPIRLWLYVAKARPQDGRLMGYDAKEIETIIGWWGKDGQALESLVVCGFLEQIQGGYQCHDWMEHEGHLVAFKIRSRKANIARYNKIAGEEIEIPKNEKLNLLEGGAKEPSSILKGSFDAPPTIPTIPSKPNPAVAVSTESLPVLVQDSGKTEKAPPQQLPPDVVIPSEQIDKRDGSTLKAYLYHTWGREANKVSWDIQTKMMGLAKRFGWPEVYRAIDEAAKYGKMNYAYVEAIVDSSKSSDNKFRKEQSAREEFLRNA